MRTTKRKIILIISLFFYIDLISARDFPRPYPWISFTSDIINPGSVQVNVLQTMKTGVEFQINVPGINIAEIEVNNQNNHILTIPGCGTTDELGQPMLPEIIKCVAIPSSCKDEYIQINIVSFKCSTLTDCMIAPVPRQIKKISPEGTVYFENEYIQNNAAYSKNSFYPDRLIKVKKTGFIRDQKVLWLAIYPVQTNPVTNEILAYNNLKVNLKFNDDQIFTETGLGPWDHLKEALFLNYDFSAEITDYLSQDNGQVTFPENLLDPTNRADYLIITTDELITNTLLCSLAHHRAEFNGFNVALVKDSDIYQQFSDTTKYTSIKNFLVYVFNNWQAPLFGDNHLGYVLLVGEGETKSKNVIPPHYYYANIHFEEDGSDFWYTCVNDDNDDGQIDYDDKISDIIIGRFSVENHQELNTITEKTINYEKELNTNESWRRKISLINGFAPGEISLYLFDDLYELVKTQNYFEISEELKRSEMELDYFRTSFIQAINEGRAIINIQSHGSIDGWGNAGSGKLFNSSDILDLSNGNKLPIVLSFSCDTGRFFDPDMDCLGEIFLNTRDRGAIAFIGASQRVGKDGNITLNRKLFENIMELENSSFGAAFFIIRFLGRQDYLYNILGDPALNLNHKVHHNFADLSISSDYIYIDWSPLAGESDTITAKITNMGFNIANNVVVKFYNGNPKNGGKQIGEDQIIDTIGRLGSYRTVKVITDELGENEITICVKVDPYDSIIETNEKNNTAFISVKEPLFLDIAAFAGVADTREGKYAAFGDYNNDGHLDLYVRNNWESSILFRNNRDGSFENITQQSGIVDTGITLYTTFIDFDNDGNLDIFCRKKDEYVFYRNNSNETFAPVSLFTDDNVLLTDRIIGSFDFNNDGLLDIYCFRGKNGTNALYCNTGNAVFEDVTQAAGLNTELGGYSAALSDYDNDGDTDIYFISIYPDSNILYQNNGNSTFTDVTSKSGLGYVSTFGWAAFGDYDNDGDMDLYLSNDYFPNKMLRNYGDGTFSDVSTVSKLDSIIHGKSGTFLDYNNDGYIDLYINFVVHNFYRNHGDGTFSKDSTAISDKTIKHSCQYGTAIGDYDNDGDIDLYSAVSNSYIIEGYKNKYIPPANILYRNRGNDNNWLVVNVNGTKSNFYGIGARIRVVSGKLSQSREITCNLSINFQKSLPVEFGLGKWDRVDTVEVCWPSGIVDVLTNVKINTILTVKEGYGDISIPNHYQLSQNYPNPFNGNTTIEYVVRGDPHNIESSSHVNLTIYNALGQKVRTVINGTKEAGTHTLTWDGKDQYGMQVASGVYIYQIKAGEFVKSKKMLFLR